MRPGGAGPRQVSFTREEPSGPYAGLTLDALMQRQKEIAAQRAALAQPTEQNNTILGGMGTMLDKYLTGRREFQATEQEKTDRQALAEAMATRDPETGQMPAEAMATVQRIDPETANAIAQDFITSRREIANREDTQAHTSGENLLNRQAQTSDTHYTVDAANARNAADITSREGINEADITSREGIASNQLASAEQIAADKIAADKAAPGSPQGKIWDDYSKGIYGSPGTEGAIKNREDALARENTPPASLMPPAEKAYSVEGAKSFAKLMGDINAEGVNARGKKMSIGALSSLLPQIQTGGPAMLTDYLSKNFGINLPGADKVSAFTAIVNNLVPQQRLPGSGTMSDADLALFKESLPRLSGSQEGNQLILKYMDGMADYNAALGELAVKASQMEPGAGAQWFIDESKKLPNPLADFRAAAEAKRDIAVPGTETGPAGGTIRNKYDDLLRRGNGG